MYYFVGQKCFFYAERQGIEFSDPYIADFTVYLFGQQKEYNTVKRYVNAIHRFWIYSLFFPNVSWMELELEDYLEDYQEVLNRGFKITNQYFDEKIGANTEYTYFESEKTEDLYYEFSALESYYEFVYDKNLNPKYELTKDHELVIFTGKANYDALDRQSKHGKGSGYGLKAKGYVREALAEKETIFKRYKKFNKGKKKKPIGNMTFPFVFFDRLLDISDDRSKLLYLLCGASGARVGQALSLTQFDVDPLNQKVYLIDPKTENVPIDEDGDILYGQESRKHLLAKYGIDFRAGKYRRYIQFKYPIPTDASPIQSLYFIREKYRKMFFETYSRYIKKINRDYPMVFQTESSEPDNIWLPSGAVEKLNRHLKELSILYPKEAKLLKIKNKMHSFRHMFGTYIANIAYLKSNKLEEAHTTRLPNMHIVNTIELYKEFAMTKMGLVSPSSIEVYFRTDFIVDSYIQQSIQKDAEKYSSISDLILRSVDFEQNPKNEEAIQNG